MLLSILLDRVRAEFDRILYNQLLILSKNVLSIENDVANSGVRVVTTLAFGRDQRPRSPWRSFRPGSAQRGNRASGE